MLLMAAHPAHAADPQPYTFTIQPTGNAALDAALRDSANLNTLRTTAPVGPFALIIRAQGDQARLATALQSFGYYKGAAQIRIDDRPVDDPALPDLIQAKPPGRAARVVITIDRGPLFHLGAVKVTGDAPAGSFDALHLHAGDPAVAANVLASGANLLVHLREDGHALAKVAEPVVIEHANADTLDVTYPVQAGPRVDIGPIAINGLHDVNESFVRRRLLVHSGEFYQPSKIEAARQDLDATGVFSQVQARTAGALDPAGTIPISFDVKERLRHVAGFTAAYSTDLGASAAVTWSDRNLFGNAEQLNLRAALIDVGGSSSDGVGYDLDAQLIKPNFLRRDQSITFNLEGIRQFFEAYDQTALLASSILTRRFGKQWSGSIGLQGEQERITQEGTTQNYTLAGIPIGAKYDSTDSLFEPTRGVRAAAAVTPTASLPNAGQGGTSVFTIAQLTGSTYFDLTGNGHSVVALRATGATVQGASTLQIPPDQRLYAGGSATVRGYKYQSVGPQFPDHNPVGGTQLGAATVELRQRIWGDVGMAAFIDAGEVTGTRGRYQGQLGPNTSGQLAVGAGLGARYYTAIGPIRLDIAVPVQRVPGNDSFELYIGIGEAF